MTIPYLPGWWDEISKGATAFVGQLPQIFEPDTVANNRFQEMVRQNPMLLAQIENMTPEARMAMEQTLGFRKQSPLRGLPVGAELRKKQEEEGFMQTATDEQRDAVIARRLGIKTAAELEQDRIKNEQAQQINDLQIKTLTGQVKNMDREMAFVDQSAKDYPTLQGINIRDIAKRVARGAQVDPSLVTRVQSEPGAAEIYKTALQQELEVFKNELSIRLTKSKDPNTGTIMLRTLAEIGNQLNDSESRAMQEYNIVAQQLQQNFDYRLAQGGAKKKMEDETLGPIMSRINSLRKASTDNLRQSQKLAESLGLGVETEVPPSPTVTPGTAGPLALTPQQQPQQFNPFQPMPQAGQASPQALDAEAQMALAAIRQRPQLEQQIRAKYKQRTGKDLP